MLPKSTLVLGGAASGKSRFAENLLLTSKLDPVYLATSRSFDAEMETKIPSVSVGEAVMQMELAHAPVLVFRNEGHGGLNVVYRREDGNVGWIDPKLDG